MKTFLRSSLYLLPLALGTAATLGGCNSKSSSDKGAGAQQQAMNVNVALPEVDSLVLHKDYPGYLSANHSVDIVARVNGTLQTKLFDDGQLVHQGQPLFTIESTVYREKVNQAEAQLATAQASYEYNTKQYEAMKRALESDAVSKMDVIQAESAMKESEAAIRTAKATLANARLMLGYCTVRAPFTGNVSAPPMMIGQYVAGEASPVRLTTIYDNSSMSVHLAVEDARVLEMRTSKEGKAVDYDHIPVLFGDTIVGNYTGALKYIAPSVNNSTGTIDLRLAIGNPTGELRAGMYATVRLPYAVDPKALVIKDAAIGTDQLGKFVYVVNDSNKVIYTPIQVGELVRDTMRIVTSGLTPQSRYVTQAMMKVRNGVPVNPVMQGSKPQPKK